MRSVRDGFAVNEIGCASMGMPFWIEMTNHAKKMIEMKRFMCSKDRSGILHRHFAYTQYQVQNDK